MNCSVKALHQHYFYITKLNQIISVSFTNTTKLQQVPSKRIVNPANSTNLSQNFTKALLLRNRYEIT